MSRGSRVYLVAVFSFGFLFGYLPVANAYLDPGSGSFIFQALVGAFLAVALTVKVFWRKIVSLVTHRSSSRDD